MSSVEKTQESIPENEKLHRSTYDPRAGHTLPTHGDYARTIAKASAQGILSTLDREDGTPYGSVVELLPLEEGNFVVFVSNMADHTKNLKKDPRGSILVADGFGNGYALALSRATFMGTFEKVKEGSSLYRDKYLELHPEANIYIDFPDFAFYKLNVERVRYIGGFGRMSWVEGPSYLEAAPDPLWQRAEGIIKHMNDDHQQNMRDYAKVFGDVTGELDSIEMTCVDRFGFELRAEQNGRGKTIRISFSEEVQEAGQVRKEMVAMAKQARAKIQEIEATS